MRVGEMVRENKGMECKYFFFLIHIWISLVV